MRCAVVDQAGNVTNVIVANPDDEAPDDARLIAIPDDSPVGIGWTYSESEQRFAQFAYPLAGG